MNAAVLETIFFVGPNNSTRKRHPGRPVLDRGGQFARQNDLPVDCLRTGVGRHDESRIPIFLAEAGSGSSRMTLYYSVTLRLQRKAMRAEILTGVEALQAP